MKSFDYYANVPVHYPNRKDYNRYHVFLGPTIIGENLTLTEANLMVVSHPGAQSVAFFMQDEYRAHLDEFKKASYHLEQEFKQDLFDEFGVTADNPKVEKAFALAWERGHSDGFRAVVDEFSELVELILP